MAQKIPKTKKIIMTVTASILVVTVIMALTSVPKADKLPDDLSGCIIIFYKDSCPDCQATMDQIRTAFKDTKDVFFLDSRSETGKEIRDRYPIHEVPSAIYIHTADDNYTMYVLYKKTEEGAVTDFDAIDRIIEIKHDSR